MTDTSKKRASALSLLRPGPLPPADDGTLTQADRQAAAHIYAGLLSGDASVTTETTSLNYYVFSSIVPGADWTTIVGSSYTWAELGSAFTWEDMSAGQIPPHDVLQIGIDRRASDIFEGLSIGNIEITLDNFHKRWSPENNSRVKPGAFISVKARSGQHGSNLLPWSENFTQWSASTSQVASANTGLAPNSAQTADTLTDYGVGFENVAEDVTIPKVNTPLTTSIFVKKDPSANTYMLLHTRLYGTTPTDGYTFFHPASGTVVQDGQLLSQGVINYNTDYWRLWQTVQNSALNSRASIAIHPAAAFDAPVATGSATGAITLWGAMLDRGAISLRDYISTQGSARTTSPTWYALGQGYLETIRVNPRLSSRIQLRASDRAQHLKRDVQLPILLNTFTNSLITAVLDAADIPIGGRALDRPPDDMHDVVFLNDQTGGSALQEIVRATASYLHVDGRGRFVSTGRHATLFQSPEATFDEFLELNYTMDKNRLINDAVISGTPRTATSVSTLAYLEDDPQFIPSSETLYLSLEYVDPINNETPTPANSIVAPVAGTDYVLNTQTDGNGTDLTSATTIITNAFATSARMAITNNSSAHGYLTTLQLRGVPLRRGPEFKTHRGHIGSSNEQTSIDQYGRFTFELQSDLIPSAFYAIEYDNWLGNRYSQPRGSVSAQIVDVFPQIAQIDLLDQVTLVETTTAVSSTWVVRALAHDIDVSQGIAHALTLTLEKVFDENALILDDSIRGKLDAGRIVVF